MKLIRIEIANRTISGFFDDKRGTIDGIVYDMNKARFLPPADPTKIICIGFNYKKHVKELPSLATPHPTLTLKAADSIIGHMQDIRIPPISNDVQHEAELGIVIGKEGYGIREGDAKEHILGYTIVNDVTARDIEKSMIQWSASKSFPTFCPAGPLIETEFKPENQEITCSVNGEVRQKASIKDMIYNPFRCVEFASTFMKLNRGDIIATGTPSGIGKLKEGDIVEIKVDGIGTLSNNVRTENPHRNR